MPEDKKQQSRKLPSLRNLINLVNFCEMEKDPVVRKLLAVVTVEYDPDLVTDILERIQPALNLKMLNPDPFSPNPKGGDVDGPVKIGKVKTTRAPFGLTLEELNQHTLIAGRAGSGKTTTIYLIAAQLIQQRIPFWAFDFKQDYRHFLRYRNDCYVFNAGNFKFNPLRPPVGSDPVRWMQAFTNVFAQAYYLMAGTKGILQDVIYELYHEYDVFSGKDVYPSIQDLLERVRLYPVERQYGRIPGFVESAQNRLKECILPLNKMFDCDKGFPIEDLLNKTVIFELDGLLSENQVFLTTLIMRFIFEYRISNKQRGRLRHLILFDEGKMVYDRSRDNIQGLGPNEVTQFTSQIREFGEGLIVADQMPIILSDSIKSNVYTTICLSQSGGKNVEDMARAMGLKGEQIPVLTQLVCDRNANRFEAIARMSGKWPSPFVIEIIPFEVQKSVTEYELNVKMRPLIEQLTARTTPRTPYTQIIETKRKEKQAKMEGEKEEQEASETKPGAGLTSLSTTPRSIRAQNGEVPPMPPEKVEGNILIRILTDIREHPFSDQKERIERLKLSNSSSTNNKYFKELEKEELVKTHKISLGRIGVKVFYEITDKGRRYSRMNDFTVPGKGDFKHKFWQHTIRKYFEDIGYNAEIEKRYGSKNADVGLNMNGKLVAVEIELSPAHLIENITKDIEAGCDIVIIAVQNKTQTASYRKKLQKAVDGDILKRIEIRILTEFLK
jgi:hypothetical protein